MILGGRKIVTNKKDKLGFLDIIKSKKFIRAFNITYGVVWNLTLVFLITLLIGGFFAGGIGIGYFASLVKDEPIRSYESMKKAIYNYEETSEIYFANDVYLGKLRSDLEREQISIEEMKKNPYLINAIIATEDENFYEHSGIVPKAILRALFQEVTNSSVSSGGSTLTQQLIKNQILTNEVSFERKAKEILLALRLEQFFDKDEIIEAYLNVSTFGRNASGRNIAGVSSAAQGIFGKEVADLTLPQAAFIAGLPQSPFGYTPYKNTGELKSEEGLKNGLNRMKTVLNRMYNNGFITKEEYDQALAYDITNDFLSKQSSSIEQYPYLTTEVESRAVEILTTVLAKKDGYEEEDLNNNQTLKEEYKILAQRSIRQDGYDIHTTIHKEIYEAMQEVKDSFELYGRDKVEKKTDPETGEVINVEEPVQVGSVLMDNKTGAILSFIGGRDFSIEQTNHATKAYRQNGSTMKPLLVYAPAIEAGLITPSTLIPDAEVYLNPDKPGTPYPTNYNKNYNGLVTARYALAQSLNIPAMLTYKTMLSTNPVSYLEKMNFSKLTSVDYTTLSLSLGALSNGVTVEENTSAFATFANGGNFVDSYMIDKIYDKEGNLIYEHEVVSTPVFSEETAYVTIDMLRDVISSGTASSMKNYLNFQSDFYAKTGTTQNNYDVWFVTSNPTISFGLWFGYDTLKPMDINYKGSHLTTRTINLSAKLLNAAYQIDPEYIAAKGQNFKKPSNVVEGSYCTVTGFQSTSGCPAGSVATDLFIKGRIPTAPESSFGNGKYVQILDKKYAALDSTPEDFVEKGMLINLSYFEDLYKTTFKKPEQFIPAKDAWANIFVANAKLEENGAVPSKVTITTNGNKITWNNGTDTDLIGYRLYEKVGDDYLLAESIKITDSTFTIQVKDGEYYVTAVDIAGKESSPSNKVTIGQPVQVEPPSTQKPDSNNGSSGDNDTNGSNQNNGNNGNNNGGNNNTNKPDDEENQPNDPDDSNEETDDKPAIPDSTPPENETIKPPTRRN